ncbi:MAG TPA: hypothetical protein VNJ03_14290 [Vicinamibacterales bacterium]|nr:hypothetical protein [Vicinamibacterales bacterium]
MRIHLAVALVTGVLAWGAQAPTAADLQKLGPQVGQRVPEFTLRDQSGNVRTLASVLGKNGAMIVFFRSADW